MDSKAKLFEEINAWNKPANLIGFTESTSNKSGTGGMVAKLKEATRCAKRGLRVAIAGNQKDVILRFARGESVGTTIAKVTRLKAS